MSAKVEIMTHFANINIIGKNLKLPMINLGYRNVFPLYYYASFTPVINKFMFLYDTQPIPYFGYFQLNKGESSLLRLQYFDLVRALGNREAWVFDENLPDIIDDYFDPVTPLEEMVSKMVKDAGYEKCPEFCLNELKQSKQSSCSVYRIYHDCFTDCFELVDKIEQTYNVIVLGLMKFNGYIRVIKNGQILFLDYKTGNFSEYRELFKWIYDLERSQGFKAIDLWKIGAYLRVFKDNKIMFYNVKKGEYGNIIENVKLCQV